MTLQKCGDILGIPLLDSLIVTFDNSVNQRPSMSSIKRKEYF